MKKGWLILIFISLLVIFVYAHPTIQNQAPINNTNTTNNIVNFIYNVSEIDNLTMNCSLFLFKNSAWELNQSTDEKVWYNWSDGISASFAGGLLSPHDIVSNGSDFWALDWTDREVYHIDKDGNDYGDGFSTTVIGAAWPTSITTNETDFWILDSNDDWVYHTNKSGTNLSDGFSTSELGAGNPEGLTTNGSDFWILDYDDNWVYHTNATGGNISDGFSTSGLGSGARIDITTNGSDFWILNINFDYIIHVDANGNNMSDYVDYKSFANNIIAYGINLYPIGQGGSPTEFWIADASTDWYYHTKNQFEESVNHTFPVIFEDGSFLWKVGCYNNNSDQGNSSAYNITIDTTSPIINLQGPINFLNTTTNYINFTFNTTDNLFEVESCNLWLKKAGVWELNSTDSSITPTINQTFNLTIEESNILWLVECNDTLNNRGNSTTYNITIDTTSPLINIVSPTNTTYNTLSVLVNITNSSDIDTVWWYNGTDNITYSIPINYNFIEGTHIIFAYANDSVGNENQTNVTFIIQLPKAESSTGGISSSGALRSKRSLEVIQPFPLKKECSEGYIVDNNTCIKLFDVEILEIDSPILSGEFFKIKYLIKAMSTINDDVKINFLLKRNNLSLTYGYDTIYFGSFDEKIKTTELYIPSEVAKGPAEFSVIASYKNYNASSLRVIEINNTKQIKYSMNLDFIITLTLSIIYLLYFFYLIIYHKLKIKNIK